MSDLTYSPRPPKRMRLVGRAEEEADDAAVSARSAALDGTIASPNAAAAASVHAEAAQVSGDVVTRLRLVSLNADGCGTYRMSATDRMHMMLDNLLTLEPDIIAFQEITVDMYSTISHRLGGWSIYLGGDAALEAWATGCRPAW